MRAARHEPLVRRWASEREALFGKRVVGGPSMGGGKDLCGNEPVEAERETPRTSALDSLPLRSRRCDCGGRELARSLVEERISVVERNGDEASIEGNDGFAEREALRVGPPDSLPPLS